MFQTILVPTDGSPLSEKAIDAAVEFARQTGAKLIGISVAYFHTPAHVSEDSGIPHYSRAYDEKLLDQARQHVRKIEDAARAANVPCETLTPQSMDPSGEIAQAARQCGCDAIFMASHGRKGLAGLFLGSETQKVIADSRVPVMVFR